MATVLGRKTAYRAPATAFVGWGLVAGGALWFLGGGMHPKDDPADVTVKERLHVMYEDNSWYPSHALLLLGIGLIAAALVALTRGGALTRVRHVQTAAVVAAGATAAGTVAAFLHLIMATDADRIAADQSTPLTDVQLVLETITAPAVGLAIAALAVVGATTRALGNRIAAVFGVVGGIGYALAGGTVLFTDALDPLFPLAGAIGLWAAATGISLVRRARTATASPTPVAP